MVVIKRIALLFFLPALLVATGCGSSGDLSRLPSEEMSGIYISENGGSWFRPCSEKRSGEAMWVTFTDAAATWAREARSSGELRDGRWYFVRWSAAITTGGEVGPGGPGVPAILVREVREMAPDANGDCVPDVQKF